MNENTIRTRLQVLFTALQYSSEKTAMLTISERILINQERAHWMRELDDPSTAKNYEQTGTINRKINNILDLIQTTGWISPTPKTENYE
jgi:hypothetical protein